jgi:hypothetical protein
MYPSFLLIYCNFFYGNPLRNGQVTPPASVWFSWVHPIWMISKLGNSARQLHQCVPELGEAVEYLFLHRFRQNKLENVPTIELNMTITPNHRSSRGGP